MAINTAEKRKSAAGVKRIAARVTSNSSKDGEWRAQVARMYSGIAIGGAVTEAPRQAPFIANIGTMMNR